MCVRAVVPFHYIHVFGEPPMMTTMHGEVGVPRCATPAGEGEGRSAGRLPSECSLGARDPDPD